MSLYSHRAGTLCGITERSGMTQRMGVLQKKDTGFSGRMGWEGEEQELCSVQRGGCSVQEVAYGASLRRARGSGAEDRLAGVMR